jgi:hypothetical protein
VTEWGWQVAGYTSPGSTLTELFVPGNQYRLSLWPDTGELTINGQTRDYTLQRVAFHDSNDDGILEAHNRISLEVPLSSLPLPGTEVASAWAESVQATYLRESIKMLRGTYTPQSGRPNQNYSYVQLAVYFRNHDGADPTWGMFGVMRKAVPDWANPGEWILDKRPAADAFTQVTS